MVSNLYEYSKNDPINNLDISGHQTLGSEILSGVLQDINNAWNALGNAFSSGVDNVNQTIVKQGPNVIDPASEGLTYAAYAGLAAGFFTGGAGFTFAEGAIIAAQGLDAASLVLSIIDFSSYNGSAENMIRRGINFSLNFASGRLFRLAKNMGFAKRLTAELTTAILVYFDLAAKETINEVCPVK